jgi:hypothetical protein
MHEAAEIEQAGTLRRYQKPTLKKSLSLVKVAAGGPGPVPIGSAPLMAG